MQALTPGVFSIGMKVTYVDDDGKTGVCQSNVVEVTVNPTICSRIGDETVSVPILAGRVTTGMANLDALLYGGFPEGYVVALSASPSDERRKLIESFIGAGAKSGEPTFCLTSDVGEATSLIALGIPNLFLFVCSLRMDAIIHGQPNVFELKGVENLTEIDIALTKGFRLLDSAYSGVKRACIGVVSDVLLQHKAIITRKWLGGLLADLKTRGFTTLAVINPQMHPKEEVQAIASLFEGELKILESETPGGNEKRLKVTKLYNKEYLTRELAFTAGKSQGDLK
jgi:hypothetical protein